MARNIATNIPVATDTIGRAPLATDTATPAPLPIKAIMRAGVLYALVNEGYIAMQLDNGEIFG